MSCCALVFARLARLPETQSGRSMMTTTRSQEKKGLSAVRQSFTVTSSGGGKSIWGRRKRDVYYYST